MQKLYPVSESVTKNACTESDPGSRFDGRNNAIITIVLLYHPRFLFHLRKDDRKIIIVIRIIFPGEANQWFGRNLANRNGATSGKRMLRSDRHGNAFLKQLLISHVVQRTGLGGRNDQSEVKPSVAYPIEDIFDAPIVRSDVHV